MWRKYKSKACIWPHLWPIYVFVALDSASPNCSCNLLGIIEWIFFIVANLVYLQFHIMITSGAALLNLFKSVSGVNDSPQNSLFVFFVPFVVLNNTRWRWCQMTIVFLGLDLGDWISKFFTF